MEALDDLQSKSGVSAEDRSSASLSAAYGPGSSSKRPPPPVAAAVDVRPSAQPSNAQPYFQRHHAAARAAAVAAAPWHALTSAFAHVRRAPPPVGPPIGAQLSQGTYDPSPASSYVSDSRRRNASRPFVPPAARKYRRPHCCAQPATLWTIYILFCAGVVGAGILIGDLHVKQVVLTPISSTGGNAAGAGAMSVQVKDGKTSTVSKTVTAAGSPTSSADSAATPTSGASLTTTADDSALHKVFYGSASCRATCDEVDADILVLSKLTTRVRLYSSVCGQDVMVVKAIRKAKADIKVMLGVQVAAKNATAYTADLAAAKTMLQSEYKDLIDGVVVGNEFLLLNDNSAVAQVALAAKVQDAKAQLSKIAPDLALGNADIGSMIVPDVVKHGNMVLANIHAWWSDVPAAQAADNVMQQYKTDVTSKFSGMTTILGETGWPVSLDQTFTNKGGGKADPDSLNTFLQDFICTQNKARLPYYFFEFIDEPWKNDVTKPVSEQIEGSWGLWDRTGKLKKGVVIPDCL